jgi:BirA family transcriptional regulator, biotin operon repressor / biotin---[acetyl-CoA-carboxylase] ligase
VRRIVVLTTTTSTNDDARRLAAEGALEGTVVLAEGQSAGRGRLGRTWDSPDRTGLYLSVLLRPADPPERIGRYPIAAAVALLEACRASAGDRVALKWPNDVLAVGRKLAGVLAELRQGVAGAELVLGIGINVNQGERDFPGPLRGRATSLRALRDGVAVDREAVAAALLDGLASTLEDLRRGAWTEVADRFLRYAPDADGRRVRLASGGEGVTRGLDASGALRVATANGIVLVHGTDSVAIVGD